MSVLIKGMETPTSCYECTIKSWDGEDDVCPFSGISALSIGRQDGCPLVPVPPHGRSIDADVLSQMFDPDESFGAAVLEIIADTPTIIPAEEGE